MEKLTRKEKLTVQVSMALTASMVSVMPMTYGAPILDKVESGNATVNVGTTTTITSQAQNNVIDWKDFSMAKGERIEFDGGAKTNNYLNVVTGGVPSQLNGELAGGKDVYIVNPKGVVFGKDAKVDVGNLYVSTTKDTLNTTQYLATGASPLVSTASTAAADVVNMGTINASTVTVEGGTIKFLDTAKVSATGTAVNLTGNTAIKLGAASGTTAATYTTNQTPTYYTNLDSSNLFTETAKNLSGNYWLTEDVDLKKATITPIGSQGTAFSGTFDGNFFTVSNFAVSSGTYGGLFGDVTGKIEHLGVSGANISGTTFAGGIAGKLSGGTISQSFVKDSSVVSTVNQPRITGGAGGITGVMNGGKITESYVADLKGSLAGGIVGNFTAGNIENAYSKNIAGSYGIYFTSGTGTRTLSNVYTTAASVNYGNNGAASALALTDTSTYHTSDYYTTNGQTWDISKEGGEDTVWRIYEGQTLPLLRCFLKANGTKLVDYNYNFFDRTTNAVDANGLTSASTTSTALSGHSVGENLTTVYNGDLFKTVDDTTNNNVTDPYANDSLIKKTGIGTTGVRAAGTYNLYYSTQDGYDLVGNYLTIKPKDIKLSGATVNVNRVYDGTRTLNIAGSAFGSAVGIIAGDDAHVDGLTAVLGNDDAGTYSTKNGAAATGSATNNGITVSNSGTGSGGVTIQGTDAANYKLDSSSVSNITINATVDKRTLYLASSASGSIDKYYDGTSATINAPTGVISIDTTKTTTDARGYDAGLVAGDTVNLDTSNITTNYVDASGNTTANATANSVNGAAAVRYGNIALDAASAVNYQLGDANGQAYSGTAYYDVAGKINQRVLDPTSFVVKDANGKVISASKTYDGTTSYTLGTGATITAAQATSGVGTTADTGLGIITADYANIAFNASTGDFEDANGNKTSDATQSGYTTAATKIGYNAQASVLNGASASLLENYTLNSKTLDSTSTYSVSGTGSIALRDLTVGLTTNSTGIDKTYDATDAVDSKYNTFASTAPVYYASGTTAANQLVNDQADNAAPTFTVTGTYQSTNGEGAANVLLSNGKEAAKNITFDVTLTGSHAQNYSLNGTPVTTTVNSVSLTGATGTIKKRDLKLSFAQLADKTYDASTALTTTGVQSIKATLDDGTTGNTVIAKDGTTINVGSNGVLGTGTVAAVYTNPNADTTTPRTVNYTNLITAIGQTSLNNYNLLDANTGSQITSDTDVVTGLGTINPLPINNNLYIDFNTISKVYDGSNLVKGYDTNGKAVSAQDFVQNNAYVLANGVKVPLGSTLKVNENATHYNDEHSNNSTAQGVTYVFDMSSLSSNFTLQQQTGLSGNQLTVTVDGTTQKALQGTITPRAVTVSAIGGQTKTYDTTRTVKDAQGNTAGAGLVNMQTATSSTPITGLLTTDNSSNQSTALYKTKDVSRNAQGKVAQDKVVDYTLAVDTAHAGDYYFVDSTGATVTTLQTKNNEITPAPLTLNAATIEKVYYGTTDTKTQAGVELQTTGKTISLSVTPLKGDTATVSYQTAEYTSPNVIPTSTSGSYGTQGVVYDGLVLSGTDAGNYFLADSQGKALAATTTTGLTGFTTAGSTVGLGIITPLTLTANDVYFNYTGVTKAYDGTSTVTSTKGPNNDATDYVTDAYIAAGNGLKINYQYTINRADYVNSSNAYDEHANGTATTKGVRYQVTLKPGSTSNYTLTNGTGTNNGVTVGNGTVTIDKTLNVGNITPLAVQVALTQPVSKTYNGLLDTGKQGSQLATFTGLLTTDGSSNQTTAVFQDKNVGTNKAVVYTFAVDSTHANDYEFYYNGVRQSKPTTNDGTIKAAPLQLTFTPVTKTYDTTTATVDSSGNALTTPAASKALNYTPLTNYTNAQDQVTVGYQTATYNSPDVATATTVTYDGLTLTGADAGNYYLVDGQGNKLAATTTQNLTGFVGYGAGTITPVSISDSNIHLVMNNAAKMYDGKNDVAGYQSDGKGGTVTVTADDFVNGTQTFVDFNGDGTLNGADFYLTKGSYTLTGVYTGTNAGTYTGGNQPTQSAVGTTGVNYTLTLNNGSGGTSNYTFQSGFNGTVQRNFSGTIKPQEVKYTITPQTFSKTYDATTAVKDSAGNVLSGDSLVTYTGTISGALTGINTTSAVYDTMNAGTNKDVLYTLGLNNSNYQLIDSTGAAVPVTVANGVQTATTPITETGVGTINKYQVAVQFDPVTKVYDNTTNLGPNSTISYQPLTQPGLSDGVTVSLTGTITGQYASPDVKDNMNGAGKVTYTGFTINPAAATNYELVDANNGNSVITATSGALGAGTITQLPVTPDMFKFDFSTISKIYDGTADVAYTDLTGTAHKADEFITGYVDLNKNGTKDGNDIFSSFTINSAKYAGSDVAYSGGQVAAQGVTYQVTLNNAASGPTSNYSYNGVLQTQFTLTQDQNGNALTGTITPRPTTVTIVQPHVTKTYDGTANVVDAQGNTLTGQDLVTFDNLIAADKANANTINQTTAAYTGANVPNVGTGYTVTYTLKNTSGNYELVDAQGNLLGSTLTGTGDITARELTLVVNSADKTYDGDAAVKNYTGLKFTGFAAGEELTPLTDGSAHSIIGTYGVLSPSGTFTADANVNRLADNSVGDKVLAYSNLQDALNNATSTGTNQALASNYKLASYNLSNTYTVGDTVYFKEAAQKGKIKPLAITADAVQAEWGSISKTYDGTTAVTQGTTTAGVATTDPTQLLTLYYQSTVGDKKRVNIGYALNTDGANYAQKNHGTNLTVNYSLAGITLPTFTTASGYGNYEMSAATAAAFNNKTYSTNTGEIKQKVLTPQVLKTSGQDKIYNGNTVADNTNIEVAGIVQADAGVVTPTIVAYYDNKNASKAKEDRKVSYTVSLTGDTAGNYLLSGANAAGQVQFDDAATGTIAKRKVTASTGSGSALDKEYDGTNKVTQPISVAVVTDKATATNSTGLVAGDDVALDTSKIQGWYDGATVKRDADGNVTTRTVSFTNINLTGSDADNYDLVSGDLTGSGTITPRGLQASVKEGPTKTYDNSTAIEGKYATESNVVVDKTRLVSGDTVNVSLVTTGEDAPHYDKKDAGTGLGVNYKLAWDNGNYQLVHVPVDSNDTQTATSDTTANTAVLHANNGTIAGRPLNTVVNGAADKTYDGTNVVTNAENYIDFGNLADGETVADLKRTVTGFYSSADAADSEDADATTRTVTYRLAIKNSNYVLDESTTGTGTIKRKGLTIVADPVKRVQYAELPTSYTGSVRGLVAGGTGSASDFTFATDPADKVSTVVPGNYGIYGWYDNRTSGNYGRNYTFMQDAGNSTALEVFNMKDYHDRKVPISEVDAQNAGYSQMTPTNFGEFFREPNAAIAYEQNGQTAILNGNGTASLMDTHAKTADVLNGTGSYSTAMQLGGSQTIGSISVQAEDVVNIDSGSVLDLQQDSIAVESRDPTTGAGIQIIDASQPQAMIIADSTLSDEEKNYSDTATGKAEVQTQDTAAGSNQASASIETTQNGVNVAG